VASGGIDAAIAWLQKLGRSPQRLLVDISASSRPLDELDRLADACEPSVEVFVVGDRNDVGLYRSLLARGVRDYLVKPLSAELLRNATQDHGPAVARGRHGKSIAVLGTRGGVGTTTVAANLARDLARGGVRRRVVYLDLNVHDGCGAGMLGRPGGTALTDVLGNIDRLDQQYLERTLADAGDRLYVLAAEIEYLEDFQPDPDALGMLLDTLAQFFHYVVVDVSLRGGSLVEAVLSHARLVCLVTDPSVHSARTLARLTRYIEARPNPPSLFGVLNHPQPASRHRVNAQDFVKAVDVPLQVQIAYDAKAPALAENLAGELATHSEFARGIQALANLPTGESVQQAPRSVWRRLLGKGAA
jgi:pilus assembly protein CpaE